MKKQIGLLCAVAFILSGCATSSSMHEVSLGIYKLESSNDDVKTGSMVKEALIKEGTEYCLEKGAEFVLVSSNALNAVTNYRPASAQIEFSCKFAFRGNRDYSVTQNEADASWNEYQGCMQKVISKVYYKTTDQDEIATLAFNMCKPELIVWKYADGYANGKDKEEIDAEIEHQLKDPSFGYEALLTYQRKALLTGKIL